MVYQQADFVMRRTVISLRLNLFSSSVVPFVVGEQGCRGALMSKD